MKRIIVGRTPLAAVILALCGVLPVHAGAQDAPSTGDPVARLTEVLPPEVASTVIERVERALAMGLPTRPIANLALEGALKGRGAAEVIAAVDALAGDLVRAGDALRSAGRAPAESEVEAATVAMRMGVDGETVAALARSGPPGRSMSVPLLVIGNLAQRGMPADEALAQVLDRLAARVDDAGLVAELAGPGGGPAGPGRAPGPPGRPGAGGVPAGAVPGGGMVVPLGPPDGAGPPAGRPGRGRPPAGR